MCALPLSHTPKLLFTFLFRLGWGSEDNLQEPMPSFHPVDPDSQTPVLGLTASVFSH